MQVIEGGYFHNDGSWVEENSLLITLIGIPRKTVYRIAKDLCTLFNQESVMITGTSVLKFNGTFLCSIMEKRENVELY